MKKLLLFCIGITPVLSFSQDLQLQHPKRCATYQVLENYRKEHPEAETDQQFESWLNKKKSARIMTTLSTVTMPVVFHIIHNGETEASGTNISQAAIQYQIMQLNKDFANGSNSSYAAATNSNIQFALAQTDPLGNLLIQPGIDRINRNTAGFSAPPYTVGYASASNNYLSSTIKPATIWDPNKYLNIWVLPMENSILGIATFPGSSVLSGLPSSESSLTCGVAIVPTSVGSVFSSTSCSGFMGRTLTHEMGHFFGLRHIWGDATCGTDYCNDTPIHEDSNYGFPFHPKSNNCGTPDEMFENYMDYTDDPVMNTFTVDQVSRMQTVLTNSPMRNTLSSSAIGIVTITSNKIAFAGCSSTSTTPETGTTGTYPRYHDVTFNLNVEDKASGNATLNVNAGGTAISNFHYQLLTPTINLESGDYTKIISIRILDNVQVEGDKTIILSYSISGTGVQAASSMQSITITIKDDDNIKISENPINLLTQDFEGALTGWNGLTTSGMPNKFWVGAVGNAGGSGKCAFVSDNGSANTYTKTTSGVSVLRSPMIDASGFTNLQLTFKYKVWGEEDAGFWDFGQITYATPGAPTSFSPISAAGTGPYAGTAGLISGNPTISLPNTAFAGKQFYLGFYWQNDDNSGNNPAFNVDDIVLTGLGTPVETTASNSYGYDIRSGNTINTFRGTNDKAIAKITNASMDVSGITASVTQTGSGQVGVTTPGGSYMRTQKVIQLSPATPNATVTYQATFYFTASELAIWGTNKLNLKILKINDGVVLSDLLTNDNATLVAPSSVIEDVAAGYIAYTANFTGFSQFVLVSPTFTLPVNFISFEAKPVNKSIELTWQTAREVNNKGFSIERSNNGTDFLQIGWVLGKGTTSSTTAYNYTDKYVQPNLLYYYRLRQTDFDNHQSFSSIRHAKINEMEVTLSVFPNPASDKIKVFISGATGLADISLIDAKGQELRYWPRTDVSSSPCSITLGDLAKGQYLLIVHLNDRYLSTKLAVQ